MSTSHGQPKSITTSKSINYPPPYKITAIACRIGYSLVRNIRYGFFGSKLRRFFLLRQGCKIAKSSYIGPNVIVVSPHKLCIGHNVSIHGNCYIDSSGEIEIGDDVSIAHDCSLISFNHTYYDKSLPIKQQPLSFNKIIIENNCWIGCKSIILAGANIKTGSIVAAGAVVTKSFPESVIVGGNPAHVIKNI